MRKIVSKDFDRTNFFVGLGVGLTSLVVYLQTIAPTVSFWDCGEFITVSHILGIPHPPGTPLYVLIGRLFAVLPTFTDLSARVNLLSAVSSAFTAFFGYLTAVRMLRLWFGDDRSLYSRVLIYGGAASGALFLAFSLTHWNNSVEAEVYGLAMLMMIIIVWLTLIYYDKGGTFFADRVMLLVFFLAFLGIGVHMTVFMVLPVVALFFILKKDTPLKFWFLVAVLFILELYFIFAMSSRPKEIPYYIPLVIVMIFYAFYVFSFDRIPRYLLLVGAGFLLSVAPLFLFIIRAIQPGRGEAAPDLSVWSNRLSILGSVVIYLMLLYAIYALYTYLRERKSSQTPDKHRLVVSLFILVAGLMNGLLLLDIRGYINFIILTAFLIFILSIFAWRYIRWPILTAVLGTSMIVIGIMPFVYGVVAAAVIILVMGLLFKMSEWKTALAILVVTVAGFSVHLFIPIRSAQDPFINENNPSEGIKTTINFLERRQYGSESMISRMFTRRAEWVNQFGDYRRMGFWGFFSEQYGPLGKKFLIIFILGLYGMWEIIRRKPPPGIFFFILILITSVGLVLYMNFADGMRQHPVTGADYLEVRDRDYFFTPNFILFALAIGFGLAVLMQFVRETVAGFSAVPKKIILASLFVLLLVPVYTLAGNYHRCDRSNNFIPFDYAWNLLSSADENAVLFTNADNDTFPVWCLQKVYGIRDDVKLVNLSLAQTFWYIKQVRDYLGIKLSWTDAQIDSLRPYRLPDGRTFRLNNQLVDNIIDNNADRLPINFCITTSASSRQYHGYQIDSMLELSGFKWYMKKQGPRMTVNVDESLAFLTDTVKVRLSGLDDDRIYKDEASLRTTLNIANAFSIVADTLLKAGRLEDAERVALRAVQKIPHAADPVNSLALVYAEAGKADELEALIKRARAGDQKYMRYLLGSTKRKLGLDHEAELIFKNLLAEFPGYTRPFEELIRLYMKNDRLSSLDELLVTWLTHNPADNQAKQFLNQLREQARQASDKKNKN